MQTPCWPPFPCISAEACRSAHTWLKLWDFKPGLLVLLLLLALSHAVVRRAAERAVQRRVSECEVAACAAVGAVGAHDCVGLVPLVSAVGHSDSKLKLVQLRSTQRVDTGIGALEQAQTLQRTN